MSNINVSKYSIMSQLGSDTTFALRKSIDDILANESEAPVIVSRSQSFRSSARKEHGREEMTSAVPGGWPVSSPPVDQITRPSSGWKRNAYPRTDNGGLQDLQPQASEFHVPAAAETTTTLRRTRGLERLRSRSRENREDLTSRGSSDEAETPLRGMNQTTGSTPTSHHETKAWARSDYPLRSWRASTNGSPPLDSPIQTGDTVRQPPAEPVVESSQNPTVMPFSYPVKPQPSTSRSSASVAAPTTGITNSISKALAPSSSSEVVHGNDPRQRRRYPLQSPASSLHLRSPLTPPSSSAGEEHSPKICQHPHVGKQPSPMSKLQHKLQRNMYPIQHLPSVANLRTPRNPQLAAKDQSSTQHREDGKNTLTEDSNKATKFHRGVYPMQHLPSLADLRAVGGPSSVSEANTSHHSYRSGEVVSGRDTVVESNSVTKQDVGANTQLTSPTPLISPSRALIGNRDSDSHLPTANSGNDLATKVVQQWRRQNYPVQASDTTILESDQFDQPQRAHLEPPTLTAADDSRPASPAPIHLPKNMRAVNDADRTYGDGRTIVVCLDGTGDKFDSDNSNIVQLISALKKDDPAQVSYYQAGIGTYQQGGGLSTGISSAMDMAVGSELGLHVRDAYQFLMHSYKEGDKICIFGFSRGA